MESQIRRKPVGDDQRPAATLSYGDHFGPYVITGFAGCGATSYVYRARRRDRFEPVAIKVLHPHLVADPTRRLTFYREARIMMRMDHPNVVRFEEIIEDGDTLAFVMEYVDGMTLDEWRRANSGRVDEQTLACVFVDVLRGVTAAHREGVVHRDLKPGNILIGEQNGRSIAKIIDFGVARFVDKPLTTHEKSKIIGTAAYISPEEVGSPQRVGPQSDLYSIGVMLYEAACGQRPFDGMDTRELLEAHVRRQPERPGRVNPEMSRHLEEVILQTLGKNPGQRFSSAPEMIGALESVLYAPGEGEVGAEGDDELDQMATTHWERADEQTEKQQEGGVGTFLRSCLQVAAMLVPDTGAENGADQRHYLNRNVDPRMPF